MAGSDRHVDVGNLPEGVDAGVGPTRHRQQERRFELKDRRERGLDDLGNGPPIRLAGPAGEVGAVVTEVQTQTDEPAVPGRGGGLAR